MTDLGPNFGCVCFISLPGDWPVLFVGCFVIDPCLERGFFGCFAIDPLVACLERGLVVCFATDPVDALLERGLVGCFATDPVVALLEERGLFGVSFFKGFRLI